MVVATVVSASVLAAVACGSSSDPSVPGAAAPGTTGGTAEVLAAPADGASSGDPAGTDPAVMATAPSSTEPADPPIPDDGGGVVPVPIATTSLALIDVTRPTVSQGVTVAATRSLPTAVAYPTTDGPWPLIVFAHGFRLGPPGYVRMVRVLAEAGYVVAVPSFPLADEGVAGARVDRGDLPNQPGDLSFVIDQVLAASSDPASPLAGRIDPGRIGAVGHSDGADTVLELGYHPMRADGRVRAVVALSPDAVVAAAGQVGGATPLLLEHGDADSVVPFSESVSVFAAVAARRYLLVLLGAGHLEPVTADTTWTPVLDATVTAFLDRYVAGRNVDDEAITQPALSSSVARVEVAG